MLGALLVLGGLGGAAFHPPAAALVYRCPDHRKGFAMSVHITGGSLGMAIAPLFFAPVDRRAGPALVAAHRDPGSAGAVVHAAACAARCRCRRRHERSTLGTLRPVRRPLTLLYFSVVLRTLTSDSFATFLPVLLTSQGMSIGDASAAVSLYLFASGIGGFVGGPLADRFGPRRVILRSLLSAVPFMVAAPLRRRWLHGRWCRSAGCCCSRRCRSTSPSRRRGAGGAATVSSLMMGFAWGIGSLLVPLVGASADRFGIEPRSSVAGGRPAAGGVPGRRLPDRGAHRVEPKVDRVRTHL